MTALTEREAEAKAIWEKYERPVWMVLLYWGSRKNRQRVLRYVRARDKEGAILTAKAVTRCPLSANASVRYAHPEHDLGMRGISA